MKNYTKKHINHRLVSKILSNGDIETQDLYTEERTYFTKSNTKGMQKMKRNDYCKMQEETISSKLDLQIWNKLVSSFKKEGYCKDEKEILSINGLAKTFNVSRKKISSFIRKGKDAGFIQVRNRIIFLNPFVLVPYNINDNDLHILQKEWNELT